MATINPFYRFEMPPANAGFYPECNRVSQILTDFYNAFNSVLFQFQNVEWSFANKSLKNLVAQYNVSPFFGDLVIEYPKPFPALSGIGYFEIKIYNEQLRAIHPGQQLTIVVDFTNTLVFCYFTGGIPVLNVTASLDAPFIREEQKAISGLGVVEAYGYSYFEKPYFWDEVNQVAETSLVRGRTWKNNPEFNYPTKQSSIQPMALMFQPKIPAVSNDAMAIFGLMNSLLKEAWLEKTFSELLDFFDAFGINNQWPTGWNATTYAIGSTKIELMIENGSEVIKYVGLEGASGFKFQRFIGFGANPGFNIIDVDSLAIFPIEPNSSTMYWGFYYDFDTAELTESCTEPNESYQMPIKPGDELSFIVPQAVSNVQYLTSVNVGLFSQSGVFIQKVGDAITDIPSTECTSFTFIVYPVIQYLPFPQNIGFVVGLPPTCPSTGMNTIYYSFDLNYGGNYPGTAEEWMDAMVAGFPVDQGSITYAQVGNGEFGYIYSVTWTIYQSFPAGAIGTWGVFVSPTYVDASQFCDDEFGQQWGEAVDCSLSACQKFLTANVTIPNKPFGCYRFGLYNINEEEEQYVLYSLSNLLKLDWSDCYSTILEFYGSDNSVNQGFYYANGWKHRIRLGINGGGDKPKIEENIYRQSNGVFKRPSNKLDYTLDLHTDFLDVQTQKALVDATRHDFIVWEGKPIFVTGDIEVATTQDFSTESSFETLSQVKFSVLIQNYQPSNSSCFSC